MCKGINVVLHNQVGPMPPAGPYFGPPLKAPKTAPPLSILAQSKAQQINNGRSHKAQHIFHQPCCSPLFRLHEAPVDENRERCLVREVAMCDCKSNSEV